jgi:hypothetical protein
MKTFSYKIQKKCLFLQEKGGKMTTVQMNADVYHSLSIIAEDSDLMKKAMLYLRKLARQKQEDEALMTKDEFLSMVDKRMEDYEKGEYVSFSSPEEMHKYLEAL